VPTISLTKFRPAAPAPPLRPSSFNIPPIRDVIDFFDGGDDGNGACDDPRLVRDPVTRNCLFPGSPAGAAAFEGNATLGQYGAGMVAGSVIRDVAVCPKKHVLGDDGVCYKGLANRNRMYPKGRAPLLTGGEMRAITTAGRAGKKLDAKRKTLERLGLIKKTTRGRTRLPPHQHQVKVT